MVAVTVKQLYPYLKIRHSEMDRIGWQAQS